MVLEELVDDRVCFLEAIGTFEEHLGDLRNVTHVLVFGGVWLFLYHLALARRVGLVVTRRIHCFILCGTFLANKII